MGGGTFDLPDGLRGATSFEFAKKNNVPNLINRMYLLFKLFEGIVIFNTKKRTWFIRSYRSEEMSNLK